MAAVTRVVWLPTAVALCALPVIRGVAVPTLPVTFWYGRGCCTYHVVLPDVVCSLMIAVVASTSIPPATATALFSSAALAALVMAAAA